MAACFMVMDPVFSMSLLHLCKTDMTWTWGGRGSSHSRREPRVHDRCGPSGLVNTGGVGSVSPHGRHQVNRKQPLTLGASAACSPIQEGQLGFGHLLLYPLGKEPLVHSWPGSTNDLLLPTDSQSCGKRILKWSWLLAENKEEN